MKLNVKAIDKFFEADKEEQRRLLSYMTGAVNHGVDKGDSIARVIAKEFNTLLKEDEQ